MKYYIYILFGLTLISGKCKEVQQEQNSAENETTSFLEELIAQQNTGEISVCYFGTQHVYKHSLNAMDAGTVIYNEAGDKLGTCNYAWGTPDPICEQVTNCNVIYRCENHMSGLPSINLMTEE